KISSTNGQNASWATSVNGPQSPRKEPAAPPSAAAASAGARSDLRNRPALIGQNLARRCPLLVAIQNWKPSLQAPAGLPPVSKNPSGARSPALQTETPAPSPFVTRTRSPSKAEAFMPSSPLPVSVARTAPLEARTTETEFALPSGAQMFVPSKTGKATPAPTVTVWRTAPLESSLRSLPLVRTHTLEPS